LGPPGCGGDSASRAVGAVGAPGGRAPSTSGEGELDWEIHRQDEDRQKTYTQEQASKDAERWQALIADIKAAVARGEDPASPAARELAKRWQGLIEGFTQGDPEIAKGLSRLYAEGGYPKPYGPGEESLIERAVAIRKSQDPAR